MNYNYVKVTINTKIISPYLIFICAWSLVLFLYFLHWSDLLVKLSFSLLLVLLFFIFLSYLFVRYTKVLSFDFYLDLNKYESLLKKNVIVCIFLFLLETVAAGGFPLLFLIRGTFVYDEFGLPFVHVIWYCFSSLSCSMAWLLFACTKRKKYLFYVFFYLFPGILIITRSFLLYNTIYCILISLSLKEYKFSVFRKIFFKLFIGALAILFLFGRIGEIRSSTMPDLVNSSESYIAQISKPTDSFKRTHLPSVLLWGYCYIATPLSNLQNTITVEDVPLFGDKKHYYELINHFLPAMIGKRVFSNTLPNHYKLQLVVPYFNQASDLADAYVSFGWFGIFHALIGGFVLVAIVYILKRKKNVFSYLSFIYLSVLILLNIFANMFHFMGVSPQFWIAFVLSVFDAKLFMNPRIEK